MVEHEQTATDIRLTSFTSGGGCACKLAPGTLRTVLATLAPDVAPPDELLVGMETADDAAVYRLRDDLAVVLTTDFFTPLVDDAYDWGRIAATNALSDVYAMGGTPMLALNLVGWPADVLPLDLLARVLAGGADIVRDAGALLAGGHTITDPEPKYGLAVLGIVEPDHVLTNRAAQPGDVLVLTKPIGVGVVASALKQDLAPVDVIARAIALMTMSNAVARDAAVAARPAIHAATDVTGFGLLGHLRELVVASGVSARVDAGAVPVLDGALALLEAGVVPGGTRRNHAWVSEVTEWGALDQDQQLLLADAQTSGGLLLAVAPDAVEALVADLTARGAPAAAVVGHLTDEAPGRITIVS
ncbi:MAG TPA: selenide, water dikinase SelD [Acidimicrobiia bacterium]|nr:selenide, water dikinase SelD [Acidimicrobiia bacterium]